MHGPIYIRFSKRVITVAKLGYSLGQTLSFTLPSPDRGEKKTRDTGHLICGKICQAELA